MSKNTPPVPPVILPPPVPPPVPPAMPPPPEQNVQDCGKVEPAEPAPEPALELPAAVPTAPPHVAPHMRPLRPLLLLFHTEAGTLQVLPPEYPWRVTAQECADACAASPCGDQCIAPAAAPLRLVMKANTATQTVYSIKLCAAAVLALSFQIGPHVTHVALQNANTEPSSVTSAGTVAVSAGLLHTRTVIVVLTDGGLPKVAQFPNLGVVLGPRLARRVTVLSPASNLELVVTHGSSLLSAAPGPPVVDTMVSVLHLACTRFDADGEWGSNFCTGPQFVAV